MSQYLNFYIKKSNEETYLPIGTFSRSSAIYHYGNNHAPYEKGTSINYDIINRIKEDIEEDIDRHKNGIKDLLNYQADIVKMNNTVQDKLDALVDIYVGQAEAEQEIEDLENAKRYYNFIADIINTVEFDKQYDYNNYVYFGVEWCPDYKEEN